MRILLTNDDGVFAPGLRALRKELRRLGDVTVVAPAQEQSGVGHSITLLTPLVVKAVDEEDGSTLGVPHEGCLRVWASAWAGARKRLSR